MQDELPLDLYLQEYYEGNLGKKELEGRIFSYILDNYQRFNLRNWARDECMDYLCWFYPRLSRAIDKYVNTGSSFSAYISTIIRWSSREYLVIEREHRVTEESYWNIYAEEIAVHSPDAEYLEAPPPLEAVQNPRQALVLLLKSYYYVSEDFIERAAPAIGLSKEKLMSMIDALRRCRLEREKEIRGLKERIHTQYYRCIAFENRMLVWPVGSTRHLKLKRRLENARRMLVAMRKRLQLLRAEASNRQVAEVLGIPKGTVDSNLYAVKVKFKNREDDAAAMVSRKT